MRIAFRGGGDASLYRISIGIVLGAALLLGVWAAVSIDPAKAAARGGSEIITEPEDTIAPSPVIIRIQEKLKEMNLYLGRIDGRLSDSLTRAIRAYQRNTGRRVTGKVTEGLAEHMETQSRVGVMLQKLDKQRQTSKEAARQALLSNVRTRQLLKNANTEEVADPTRDASLCFRTPGEACLLQEAVESAKAIHKSELRDWALGEILVAQAKAGFIEAAIDTVRRIGDERLIIVALRDISRAQAKAGRIDDAIAAAEIIPNRFKRLEALSAIADIRLAIGDDDGAHQTAAQIIAASGRLKDPLQRVTLLSQMAVVMSRVGALDEADKALSDAQRIAASPAMARKLRRTERGAALRHIASALAEIDQPTRALGVIEEVTGAYDRTAVLMSAATAQARAGDIQSALATADAIEGARYKAVILGRIATHQADAGFVEEAQQTVSRALKSAEEIQLTYARSYAVGQLALALSRIGAERGNGVLTQAVETANRIENGRIRAYALWTTAEALRKAGREADALDAEDLAAEATESIGSSLSQVWMFGDIATESANAGDRKRARAAFQRGIEVAESIRNAWGRARALAKMASTLSDLK